MTKIMGAEALMRSLLANGVDTCFTNPGTSEMHFVASMDRVPEMRGILTLFEGVASGMADGYGRMAEKPACTLLHLGPGLANGLANFHNARRAFTPVVNIVGDHATYHRDLDAPLTSDVEGFSRPVSQWVGTAHTPEELAELGVVAVGQSFAGAGGVATLIAPADTAWIETEEATPRQAALPARPAHDPDAISAVAKALTSGEPCALLVNDLACYGEGLELAGRVAAKTGARLIHDTFISKRPGGAGAVAVERLPYFGEMAVESIKDVKHLIMVGTNTPVSFFAYPGKPSILLPDGCEALELAPTGGDVIGALTALVEQIGAGEAEPARNPANRPDMPEGDGLTPFHCWQALAHLLPDNAIIMDEAATSGTGSEMLMAGAAPHDVMTLTGGAIGYGLPCAAGAAVACPDRKVVAMQADGGSLYTIQALWTMARENLDVTTVIFNNRSYAILQVELARTGAAVPDDGSNSGSRALDLLDLSRPDMDFVKIAEGFGVSASRATTVSEFNDQLAAALATTGPRLIEAIV